MSDDKIAGIAPTFEVFYTDENAEPNHHGEVTVSLVVVDVNGDRHEWCLTPDAARNLATALNDGADEAES